MYLWPAGQNDGDCHRSGLIVEISPSPGQARPGREEREELFCRYFFVTRGHPRTGDGRTYIIVF